MEESSSDELQGFPLKPVTLIIPERPANIICVNDSYVVFPSGLNQTASLIEVWKLSNKGEENSQKFIINGNFEKSITALAIGKTKHGTPMCAASKDQIIYWSSIDAVISGSNPQVHLLAEKLGDILSIAIEELFSLIAVCADRTIFIFDMTTSQPIAQLEGHTAKVTCCSFFPKLDNGLKLLGSVSEDRTFKIWDLTSDSVLYQSAIISSSPFVSISVDFASSLVGGSKQTAEVRFAIGSTDGKLRVYSIINSKECRLLNTIDIWNFIKKERLALLAKLKEQQQQPQIKVINSGPSWKTDSASQEPLDDIDDNMNDAEILPIVNSAFINNQNPFASSTPRQNEKNQFVEPSSARGMDTSSWLLVGTYNALLQVNLLNYSIKAILFFKSEQEMQSKLSKQHDLLSRRFGEDFIQHPSCYGFHFNKNKELPNTLTCAIGSSFQNAINVVEFVTDGSVGEEQATKLSLFPSQPLPKNSPLRQEYVLKVPEPPKKTKKGTSSAGANKPLTFNTKIKSSGYGSTPPVMKMFSGAKPSATKASKVASPKPTPSKEYPKDCGVPQYFQPKHQAGKIHQSAISRVSFNVEGNRIFTCSTDSTARMSKVPFSKYKGEGISYIGHNGAVNSVHCNRKDSYVLTASEDESAVIWDLTSSEPLLKFDAVEESAKGVESTTKRTPFGGGIKQAKFFYLDKFVLMACKNNLYLYKYLILEEKDQKKLKLSDLQKLQNNNKYKLVATYSQSAQNATQFACLSGFQSNLVISSGTNRNIDIVDFSVNKCIRTWTDTHTRPVHSMFVSDNSPYIRHTAENYDLFLTSAADSSIKMWDIRTESCVRVFVGHANRVHSIGLQFSPCMKYIATGSEDKCCYVYDIRTGTYLKKLGGHTDVVSDVAFHPYFPQLVTSCFDSQLRFFNETE